MKNLLKLLVLPFFFMTAAANAAPIIDNTNIIDAESKLSNLSYELVVKKKKEF